MKDFQWNVIFFCNVKIIFVDGKMKKWKTQQHHLSKEAFLRWEAVQLDQEGWDPGRCIFARRGFFHLVAENILWEKTFREVLDQNLVKAGAATVHWNHLRWGMLHHSHHTWKNIPNLVSKTFFGDDSTRIPGFWKIQPVDVDSFCSRKIGQN